MPKILIAGASGVVGNGAMEHFAAREGWDVVGVSRRPPISDAPNARHIQVDLTDAAACADAFGEMADVTHVYYAALNERDGDMMGGWRDIEQIDRNARMLTNLFDPLIAVARDFRHITLIHGGKAYGMHVPGLKLPVPLREDQPRHPGENFYYRQEDYIKAKQAGQPWSWTILRASTIVGPAIGANMNSFLNLVVFAVLRREAGLKLPVPLPRSSMTEMTDTRLIADAAAWAADAPAAQGQIFNIHNGDLFAIHDAYPIVARALGMEMEAPSHFNLGVETDRLAPLWPDIVKRHGLRSPANVDALLGNSKEIASVWSASVAPGDEMKWGLTSATKLRLAGYPGCVDTIEMLYRYIDRFRALRIIP
jgi:nucleoside-diphosphate-sugar epimerase